MTIDEQSATINVYNLLKPIAKKLERFDVKSCNGQISDEAYDRFTDSLMVYANDYASQIGLIAYHQSDPRGCSLYLIDKSMDDSTYNRGIAII
jgi:hypothetical protein